jgi:DNA-binding IclR family transcriptional regulator
MAGSDGDTLSSVRNAARLLREFTAADRELGVSELARRLQLSKSTVHRLLTTLTAERLLERGPQGGYRLGIGAYALGLAVSTRIDLHSASIGTLEELRNATGETVHIGVLDEMDVVHIERLESLQSLRIFTRVGHRLPAHCSGNGKVQLAALPPAELRARISARPLARRTAFTIVDPDLLMAELARVAERGWAENVEESERGVASVAAPIRDAQGCVIAGISVAGPVTRMHRTALRRYSGLVIDAAATVSRRMGYRAAPRR